ncbi:MAG: hypothetical protein ACYC2K_13680 [Gemmatimonadales bacterium]
MYFPAFEHALVHYRQVGPRRVALLTHLRNHLSLVDFKPVKALSVAHATGLSKRAVGPDLRKLTALGYLDQGPRAYPGGPFTYRLVWSVRQDAA